MHVTTIKLSLSLSNTRAHTHSWLPCSFTAIAPTTLPTGILPTAHDDLLLVKDDTRQLTVNHNALMQIKSLDRLALIDVW